MDSVSAVPGELKQITVNGVRLTYVDEGEGLPVVFIHGSFSDHRIWEMQREAVASDYRYIAMDLRYFGNTPWPDEGENFSPVNHVADVAAFLRVLRLEKAVLAGRSYGCVIALAVAVQHPELVAGLFLNEPPLPSLLNDRIMKEAIVPEMKSFAALAVAVKNEKPLSALKIFYDWVIDIPGSFDKLPAPAKTILLENARTVPVHFSAPALTLTCEEVGQIKSPVTITVGELTRPFFKILAQAAHNCLPQSRIVRITRARHGSPSEQPLAFNEALLAFLREIKKGGIWR